MTARRIAGLLVCAALMAPLAAVAGGGTSIASAPELPLGEHIVDGAYVDEYGKKGHWWKVTLHAADRLVLDYGNTLQTGGFKFAIYRPDVTDYTLGQSREFAVANQVGGASPRQQEHFVWVAPSAGRWNLLLTGISSSGGYDAGYEMTARVQRYTSTTLNGPRLVGARKTVTFRGTVRGISSGKVEMQTAKASGGWKSVALVATRAGGFFSWTTRTAGAGTYRVRALYHGDASHRPSAAALTIRVVG